MASRYSCAPWGTWTVMGFSFIGALSAGPGPQPPSPTALLYFADAFFLQDPSPDCPPPRRTFLGVPCLLRPGGGGSAHHQRPAHERGVRVHLDADQGLAGREEPVPGRGLRPGGPAGAPG